MEWAKIFTMLGIVLVSMTLMRCATSTIPEERESSMKVHSDEFVSLIYSLINDAVDQLPEDLQNKIAKDGNLDPIMEGVNSFDPFAKPINHSVNPNNFGAQACYILKEIYGESNLKDVVIPQAIYFEGFSDMDDIEKEIKNKMSNLLKSQPFYRGQYNLALNLIVNVWLNDFKKSGEIISKIPKEGVYLRDSNGNLYFYEGG